MKANLVGVKQFTGKKDGRKWLQLGLVYKDVSARGGSFASAVLLSAENVNADELKPGEAYDIDFDNRGNVLGITKL